MPMAARLAGFALPGSTEAICYSVAGVGALAPFYLLVPGAEDRLAARTARWAPRWEKNISYFTPSVERGVQRVEPPVSRTVRRIEHRLPLEKAALGLDRRIKNGLERASRHQRHAAHVVS
ncbi:uncharacterized protein DNG_10398 [Cephalotrichum gorgonifer]|uniref:Uncharacterized protein n=1 Tax=Cephalotrichum gorgonifer TaxID=2041049 RepID=A0AAE8N8Z7_9PEZI|nr:uncharacterized protein DNG_10398 [Cephalotrichum gorgonifer]